MKKIFFVRNAQVWNEISSQVNKDSVAGIYNLDYFEKFPGNILPEEIPINGLDEFKSTDSLGSGYSAVIAIKPEPRKDSTQFGGSYFYRLSLAVARTLKRNGIKFSFWPPFSRYVHVYGTFPKLAVDPANDLYRTNSALGLFQEAFKTFPQEFMGKKIDIWIPTDDYCAIDALNLANALDLPHVFSYYTFYALKDRVIAFPDYEARYNEKAFPNDRCSDALCKEAASEPWQDNRVFWRGSLFTNLSRSCLFELGKKYPQYFVIEDMSTMIRNPLPTMKKQAAYKYLIDTRGNAWSSRLQILLKLGRVVFIVDRPYRDWYFDRLQPMKHYMPVKEDLSDLIEKYCYMEQHPEIYNEIVANLKIFVEENLIPRRIVFETKELILRYGVIE